VGIDRARRDGCVGGESRGNIPSAERKADRWLSALRRMETGQEERPRLVRPQTGVHSRGGGAGTRTGVLIAEVMSHQTRLDRVVQLYPLFSTVPVVSRACLRVPGGCRRRMERSRVQSSCGPPAPAGAHDRRSTRRAAPASRAAISRSPESVPTRPCVDGSAPRNDDRWWMSTSARSLPDILAHATTADLRPEREIWNLAARLVPGARIRLVAGVNGCGSDDLYGAYAALRHCPVSCTAPPANGSGHGSARGSAADCRGAQPPNLCCTESPADHPRRVVERSGFRGRNDALDPRGRVLAGFERRDLRDSRRCSRAPEGRPESGLKGMRPGKGRGCGLA